MSVKHFFYKLLLGKPFYNEGEVHNTYKKQIQNFKRVWNNEKHDDIGLEKIIRLFLIASQFLFPGIHVRAYFGTKGPAYKHVAIEGYVIFKVLLSFIILKTEAYHNFFWIIVAVVMLIETILYVATLIFVSDMFVKPRSYRRSILLLFLNYIQIAFEFAIIYGGLKLIDGKSALSTVDYIYFSFVTSATIGYGDLCPINDLGKTIVCMQSAILLVFVVLFLNFFSSKVDRTNYDKNH